jgi:RNA polymerase sigma-70 factor (ECF subfamily)
MHTQMEHGRFETTHWSIVLRARHPGPAADRAMEEICRRYWSPLYAYARRWGRPRPDAEDAVQSFFVTALKRQLFQGANPDSGRLRNLLLTAFKRHMQDLSDRKEAFRRSPGGALLAIDEIDERLLREESASAEVVFDREWARAVLQGAFDALESKYTREGQVEVFRALKPLLLEGEEANVRQALAARLGLSASALGVALHRLRKRFREAMRDVISSTVEREEDIESEFHALAKVLAHLE